MKSRFYKLSFFALALSLGLGVYFTGAFGHSKEFCQIRMVPTASHTTLNSQMSTVFACVPSALTKVQRERAKELTKQYITPESNFTELSDGFEFTYDANEQSIKDIAEFIAYESLCCPFINFEMSVEGQQLHLKMHGPVGVKDFIRSEFDA